jgi:kinetochore protein Mis12/MTW1
LGFEEGAAGVGGGGGDGGQQQQQLAAETEEVDAEEGRLTVGSVNRLRRRLQASQRLNCMLVAERARNAALLGEMRRLVGVLPGQGIKTEPAAAPGEEEDGQQPQRAPFQFLHDKGDLTEGEADTPLTTTAAFSLSQLPALRELSTALRGVMASLAEGGGEDDEEEDGKKSWRRERLEYVETATRKHLENVRGLELGENGEVRDGEWEGGGPSLEKGEVESLERVIGKLGGSRQEQEQEQDRMDES